MISDLSHQSVLQFLSYHQLCNAKMAGNPPLLKLPPELRNRIYRYAIVQDEPIDVAETTKKKEPALLATCKEIREQALKMFYHENTFYCLANFLPPGTKAAGESETAAVDNAIGESILERI